MTAPAARLDASRLRRLAWFLAAALAIIAGAALVYYSLLLPFMVSAFLTYLLLPLVDRLERWKIPRSVAVPSIVALSLGGVAIFAVQIAPVVYRQATMLVELVPRAVTTVLETWLPLAESHVARLGFVSPDDVHRYLSGPGLMSQIETQLQVGLMGIWRTGTRLAGGMVNLMLIPILTFFMVKDFPAFSSRVRALVPRDLKGPVRGLMRRLDATLRLVLKGQVTVAGILAILYVVGFSIVGLKSAVVIGVVAGVCRVIPYLDVIVGSLLSAIVLLSDFQGWGQVLGVVIIFLVVQGIDGAFITPAVLGERIGLHPMMVIVSVIAFANWFGFWGVLLAIPVVAILKAFYETAVPYYFASRAFHGEPARAPLLGVSPLDDADL